jgi:hypothetical protein
MVFDNISLVALIYEICISAINFIFLVKVYQKKKEKTTELTTLLFLFFLSWNIANVFLLAQKIIIYIWGGIPYQNLSGTGIYIVGILHSGRFGYIGANQEMDYLEPLE